MNGYPRLGWVDISRFQQRGDSITYIINSTITNPNGTTSISSSIYHYGQDANGNYDFIDSNGQIYAGSDQFVADLTTAIGILRSKAKGNALIGDLMNSTNNVQIVKNRGKRGNSADP